MKKFIWLFIGLILIVGMMTGCGTKEQDPIPSEPVETQSIQETQETISEEMLPEEMEQNKMLEEEQYRAILEEIAADYHSGVSGCSLKAVKIASEILDWSCTATFSEDELRSMIEEWLEDSNREEPYAGKIFDIADAYDRLLTEEAEELLDTAGITDSKYPWEDANLNLAEVLFEYGEDVTQTTQEEYPDFINLNPENMDSTVEVISFSKDYGENVWIQAVHDMKNIKLIALEYKDDKLQRGEELYSLKELKKGENFAFFADLGEVMPTIILEYETEESGTVSYAVVPDLSDYGLPSMMIPEDEINAF